MEIRIEGTDSDGRNRAFAMRALIDGVEVSLPTISPHPGELEYATSLGAVINSPMVTYNDRISSLPNFRDNFLLNKSEYEKFAAAHSPKLVNYSFNISPKMDIDGGIVDRIREVQVDAKSPFLFEYEADSKQDVDSLQRQLQGAQEWLKEKKSSKILVPVIHMKIRKIGLFRDKLESLSDYKRIDVVYSPRGKAAPNWSHLIAFLNKNNVWCHMGCISDRYHRGNKMAYRVQFYLFGISSTSLGSRLGEFGMSRSTQQKFNRDTYLYDVTKFTRNELSKSDIKANWIDSLNDEIKELRIMGDHATRQTLYRDHLPTKVIRTA